MSGKLVFETEDYEGNRVLLHQARFDHYIARHPEMVGQEDAIRLAVEDPHLVVRSSTQPAHPQGERRVFCRMGVHSRFLSLYVTVPIEYCPTGNWVVTAHVRPDLPAGEVLYVHFGSNN